MKIQKHNLKESYRGVEGYWNPFIISELNGQAVKIAKVLGDFVMHNHQEEDEFFYVVKGLLGIELEFDTLYLEEGDFITIPKGVNHRPFAETETWILLFEPNTTVNTGKVESELTRKNLKKL
jgi:mannose-6-phosphate isomerase-like protein (cupin superfamily)